MPAALLTPARLRSVLLALLLWAAGPARAQTPGAEAWREDLRFLAAELEARHADLYHTVSPEAFGAAVDTLDARLAGLSDDEVVVELARLTASIGDGHTGLFLPWGRGFDFSRLPLTFHHDPDGYFILAAAPEHEDLVGARLLRIGNAAADDAADALVPLLPRDNPYALRPFAGTYLRLAGLLHTLGIVDDARAVPLVVEDADGQRRTVLVRPRAKDEPVDWRYAQAPERLPLYLRHRDEPYGFTYLPERRAVVLWFNSADIGAGAPEAAFAAFAERLVAFLDAQEAERLVIDLRWNDGGSFLRTRHLLWAVIRAERVNRPGRLFTLIGPGTFSAATAFATELDQHTATLFVGQPTGGRPKAFGDLGRIRLPRSGLEVWYSRWAMHQSQPSDHRPAIFPDLRAPLTADAYRAGRDPALEAVWAYQPQTPVADVLRPVLAEDGVEAALATYQRLRENAYNAYDVGEAQLETIGRRLLAEGQAEAALAVFQRNADVFPWSPGVYDRLGDAYRALGRLEAAREHYLRAFAIDKQYSHAWEAARALRRP